MGMWRVDDPTIERVAEDAIRVVVGGMWQHQRDWWQLPNFVKLLVGGYGSGKTQVLCKRAIASALENAPAPVGIVSPSFPMARRTVIPTLEELLDGKRTTLDGFSWSHHQQTHTFEIRWRMRRGRIMLMSSDDPTTLKGTNLGAAYFDEPFIQEEAALTQMLARVRHPKARLMELGLCGTPEQLNWGWKLAQGELGLDVGMVRASTRENKALDPNYEKRLLEHFDEKTAEAYIEGKFVNLARGQVFYNFNPERHVTLVDRPEGSILGAGMDFNVNPMAFCAFWRTPKNHKLGERIHFTHEWEEANSDTPSAARILHDTITGLKHVYPDPSGKARHTNAPAGVTDFTHLQRAGFMVFAPEGSWPIRDSRNAVNVALKKGIMTVSPKCKKMVNYLQTYTHEQILKQKDMSHLLDAMRYPVTYLFPVKKPELVMRQMQGA